MQYIIIGIIVYAALRFLKRLLWGKDVNKVVGSTHLVYHRPSLAEMVYQRNIKQATQLRKEKRTGEAVYLLKKMHAQHPDDLAVLDRLASYMSMEKKYNEAIEIMESSGFVKESSAGLIGFYSRLATLNEKAGNPKSGLIYELLSLHGRKIQQDSFLSDDTKQAEKSVSMGVMSKRDADEMISKAEEHHARWVDENEIRGVVHKALVSLGYSTSGMFELEQRMVSRFMSSRRLSYGGIQKMLGSD